LGKIVHRYILREIMVPLAFGVALFTFVLLIARILKLIELIVTRGVPLVNILKLLTYIIPSFLEVTLPMAMLLAILVAFGRLSADSEMVAMRSSGLSLYQLVSPVALVAVGVMLVTGLVSIYARPWGNRSLHSALYDLARTRATAGIRPQVFNDEFPGLVIYAEGVDATNDRLRHVLISDERDAKERNTIFARDGTMISDPKARMVTLRLRDGFIHTIDKGQSSEYQTHFQSYDVNLDLRETFATSRKRRDPKEMSLGQLSAAIAARRARHEPSGEEQVEFHRKFSIPFACIVFALVAVPLGVLPVRSARARGFAVSLALIFVYYMLLSAGQALAEQNTLPAVVGLWIPNVVFALLGLYLFGRAAREHTVLQLDGIELAIHRLRSRIATRPRAETAS
jgi:lipopolysaccharide export system permease protein